MKYHPRLDQGHIELHTDFEGMQLAYCPDLRMLHVVDNKDHLVKAMMDIYPDALIELGVKLVQLGHAVLDRDRPAAQFVHPDDEEGDE
jgi:hypothetical protein